MYEEISRRGRLTDTYLQGTGFDHDLDYAINIVDLLYDAMFYMQSI